MNILSAFCMQYELTLRRGLDITHKSVAEHQRLRIRVGVFTYEGGFSLKIAGVPGSTDVTLEKSLFVS